MCRTNGVRVAKSDQMGSNKNTGEYNCRQKEGKGKDFGAKFGVTGRVQHGLMNKRRHDEVCRLLLLLGCKNASVLNLLVFIGRHKA